MVSVYRDYHLSDNPFPSTPILDPTSKDDRINGAIYDPELMTREIQSFRGKVRRRPPIIYVENSDFVRGVGKSALLVQQWRQLQQEKGITSIYVRSEKRYKPADFAARLISRWHEDGQLWRVVLRALDGYVRETSRAEITAMGAQVLAESLPSLPTGRISLYNFNVFRPDRLISDLAAWARHQVGDGLHLELASVFFRSYLTDPQVFLDVYPAVLRRHKWDNITMLAATYRLLGLAGYDFHYLFLDQFEDVVHGLSGKSLITFNTEMRRLIEASIGQATLVVTLHPGATNTLSSDEGGDITSIAPLDQRHVVDVRSLVREKASQLARVYLDHYRLQDPVAPDPLHPFTPEAIDRIFDAAKGNIRNCLQALSYAIEKGIDAGYPAIDEHFLVQHHSDITGRVHPDDIQL